jgi:hypothetical protein
LQITGLAGDLSPGAFDAGGHQIVLDRLGYCFIGGRIEDAPPMARIFFGLPEAETGSEAAEIFGDVPQHKAPQRTGRELDLVAEITHR